MENDHKRADVRVGIFVLSALVVLVIGSLWIAGSTLLAPQRNSYHVLMKDSGGVQAGDRVRVAGVPVGKIEDVELRPGDEWPVRFHVAIRRSVPLHADSSAKITASGLLGTVFLQVDPGSPDSPGLDEDGQFYGQASAGFEAAMTQVEELGDKVMRLLDQASVTLDRLTTRMVPILDNTSAILSPENAANLGDLLASLNGVMNESGPRLSSLLTRLDSVAASADGGMERLPELTAKLDRILDDLHNVLGEDGTRVVDLLDSAQSSLGSAESALAVLGDNRQELDTAIRNLQDTTANLKAFSQTIKERPYSMVRIKSEPQRAPGEGVK
jgi:phospholipid/cholesterol/gamma-HCH transport system substrate-binding protein